MANLPTKVQPGQLITSVFMNALIDKFNEFESRLASIETGPASDKPSITKPTAGEIGRIGEEMRIEGTGFGTPSENTVFIDGNVQVSVFKPGSNDKVLLITLPFVQNVPDQGRPVSLTVSNARGFATTTFTLAQPEVTLPTGTLTATLTESPNVPLLVANTSYTFVYTIKAATNADEVYTIVPAVDLGWTARLVDSGNNAIQPQEIFIPKPAVPTVPSVVTARIRVTIPNGIANGTIANLSATVRSKRNPGGLIRISDSTALQVNGAPPAGDLIGISLMTAFSPAVKVGSDFTVPAASVGATQVTVFATFKVEVPTAGNYSFDAITFKNDPGNLWSATVVGGRQGIGMQPPQATVSLSITVKAGAPAAKMVLKVTSDSNSTIVGDIDQNVSLT